ncbi:MAG: flagellar filament capping protein FliD [Acidimicrobiales bacterium]
MATIDGLISGLNTTQLINQLMQLERQPQVRIQQARGRNELAITALQGLNTLFLAMKTTSAAMTTATGWQPATATSSNEAAVAVSAAAGAPPASLTFDVTQLAVAGSAISSGSATALSDVVASGATISVTKGADTRSINVGDGSLGAVVKAINDEKMGVTATAVQVSPGTYKLQLSSTTTGAGTSVSVAAGSFTATTLGDVVELAKAQDAVLQVGGTNPYTVTRSSNTFSDLLEGVTMTLKTTATAVTVEVAGDTKAMTAQVAKLVGDANGILADIKKHTSYDVTAKKGGVLVGDALVRGLQGKVLKEFAAGVTVGTTTYSAADFGVTVERDGTIKLDEAKFAAAYEKDPAVAEAVLGGAGGLAGRLEALAEIATKAQSTTTDVGLLTSAISSREGQRTRFDANIASWDQRLELRRTNLTRQFSALERALGQAQSQSQWLAGQLAGLNANTNG